MTADNEGMSTGDPSDRQTAADLVLDYIAGQAARLHDAGGDVRAGEPDGVHKMRVATRRLRGALVVYGGLFEGSRVDSLASELRWLGKTLAPARDLEVIGDRLVAAVEADPALTGRELPGYLARPLAQARESARDQVMAGLDSPRSEALQHALDGLRPQPPGAGPAEESADRGLRQLADATWLDLRARAADAASASTAPQGRDTALHELRKAAKRVRYALELVMSSDDQRRGADQRAVDALRELQQVLGEHHDTVATREWLRTHPPGASEGVESAAHTRLLEHERRAAQRCEEECGPILARILPG